MGSKVLLVYITVFFRSLLMCFGKSSPFFSPSPFLSRTSREGQINPDDKVKILLQKGNTIAAALQLIENVANGERRSPCQRTSLADFEDEKFQWRHSNSFGQLDTKMDDVLKTANILNHFFLQSMNESDVEPLFFYSLVKSNVESDSRIKASSIVLVSGTDDYLVLYAYRDDDQTVRVNNIRISSSDRWSGNDWFFLLASNNYSDLSDKVANGSADFTINADDGVWTAPYFDCFLTNNWHVTYGAPFFSLRSNGVALRGVVSVTIPVYDVDIDQCGLDGQDTIFSSTHRCDISTTECVPLRGTGFRRGNYRCYCKASHYADTPDYKLRRVDYFDGKAVEEAYVANILEIASSEPKYPEDFRCRPCRIGCDGCVDGEPCYVEYDMILRSLVLCFQSFCSTIVFILAVVVFRLRKSKIFSNAMWIMLETILFGALLLYQTVIIRYFEPSVITCMLEPWFRGLGFAICYGAITLKIYRILAEFQTRKAHRVCVRDKDLLKYLLGIILVVIGYLLAWTAIIVDNMSEGYSVLAQERTPTGLKYVMCRALWWDYVTEVGELLFLVFGVFLTYKVRNAKSDCFHEKSALAWSVYVEALVSVLMYTIRHVVWSNLQPDYIYLLYFLRCQCTVTIILIFIYGPKLWYHHRPPEPLDYQPGRQLSSCGDMRDHLPEMMKLHEAITSNGDVDFSDINLSDMDPEDIRTELRRVYTQLQILRNITMRKGNPHISRRRGGRKGTHRRFSLQTFHHRHKHSHDHDHEVTEVSKTPEESTVSLDGNTAATATGEGTPGRDEQASGTPTVTFKEGPK